MAFDVTRILVPTDFSAGSELAYDHALDVARRRGADLVVLHVVEEFTDYSLLYSDFFPYQKPVQDFYEQAKERAKERIEKSLSEFSEAHPESASTGHKAIVATGPPSNAIIRAVEAESIDLIVIATHGRSGIAHALLGSTAEKVIRRAPCPVLVVRQPDEKGASKK